MIQQKQELDSMQFRDEERRHLSKIFGKITSFFAKSTKEDEMTNNSIIEAATKAGADELSQKIIAEVCEDIDTYHETLAGFIKDNPDSPSEWAKEKLFQLAKEQNPDITTAEKDEIAKELDKVVEKETLRNVETLCVESHDQISENDTKALCELHELEKKYRISLTQDEN